MPEGKLFFYHRCVAVSQLNGTAIDSRALWAEKAADTIIYIGVLTRVAPKLRLVSHP